MKVRQKILLLLALLTLVAARQTSWLAPIKEASRQGATGFDSILKATEGTGLTLLEKEALSASVIGSEIRNFRFRPETKVAAGEFFTRYRESLKLGPDDLMKAEPLSPSLKIQNKAHKIVYHQQHFKGVPVLGARYNLLQDENGNVVAGTGKIVPGLDLDVTPSITEAAAFETAKKAVPARTYAWDQDRKKRPKGLLALRSDAKLSRDKFKLIWRFEILTDDPFGAFLVDIDAKTGKLDQVLDNLQEAENVSYTGTSKYDGNVGFVGSDDSGLQLLWCNPVNPGETCLAELKAMDGRRPQLQGGYEYIDTCFNDSDKDGNFLDSGDDVGVNVFWGVQRTLEYYAGFGWIGFDGLGQEPITLSIKDFDIPNAYYNGVGLAFDGVGDPGYNLGPFVSVKTAAHEFTHGVIDRTSDLVYQAESGALNEAFADIFGSVVAFTIPGKQATWRCLEDEAPATEGEGLRDLADPNAVNRKHNYDNLPHHYPDTYQGKFWVDTGGPCYSHCPQDDPTCNDKTRYNDRCGIHTNSTVVGHWFYLLVMGGEGSNDHKLHYKVDPIAMEEAALIAFDTMVYGLTPNSNFEDAAEASIQVAELQFGKGSLQSESVMDAWVAVGVGHIEDPSFLLYPDDGATLVSPWPAILSWTDNLPADLTRQIFIRPTITGQDDDPLAGGLKIAKTMPALPFGTPDGGSDDGPLEIQEGTSPDFQVQLSEAAKASPALMVSTARVNLLPKTTYKWSVRTGKPKPVSENAGLAGTLKQVEDKFWGWFWDKETPETKPDMDWGDWGPFYSFTTDERVSSLTSPKGASEASRSGIPMKIDTLKADPWQPLFRWGRAKGSRQYKVQLSETPGVIEEETETKTKPVEGKFKEPLFGMWVDPSESTYYHDGDGFKALLPEPLKVNATYYWGVQPWGPKDFKDEFIPGNWSNGNQWQVFQTLTPKGELGSPADGAEVDAWTVHLQWAPTPGAQGYLLKVSKDLACVQDPVNCPDNAYPGTDPVTTNVIFSLSVQSENEVYYWTVTPKGPTLPSLGYYEFGLPSDARSFTADASATKPVLIYPLSTNTVGYKNENVTYRWKPVLGAKEYRLTLYQQNADGTPGTADYDSTVTAGNLNSDGEEYVVLYGQGTSNLNGFCWKLQAISQDGFGGSPEEACYEMGPDRPVLISPAANATGVDYESITFTWNSEYAPEGYIVHWTNGTVPKTTAKSYTVTNLQPSTTYQWSVSASLGGWTAIPSYQSFTTKGCDPMTAPVYLIPSGTSTCESPAPATYSVSTQWGAVSGAVQYEVALYRFPNALSNDFTTRETVVAPQYTTGTSWGSATLSKDLWYGWTLRAQNSCGEWGPVSPYYFTNFICFYQ